MLRNLFLFGLLVCIAMPVMAQNSDTGRTYYIRKAIDLIAVDGELTEETWKRADRSGLFWQQYPYDTAEALGSTEIMMAYDDRNVYVAAICYDTFPGDFIISSLKRDFAYPNNDIFNIYLDPFNDKINGFCFGVNPYGAQREGLVQNGGTFGATINWDNKWYSEVQRKEGYWIVEFKIPFKTLRYKAGITEWGVNFSRNNLKINEASCWSKVPRNFNTSVLAYTGRLVWDTLPPKAGSNVSIIPYIISGYNESYGSGQPGEIKLNAGMDAKVAITNSLNLDLTVNPDFSQVDVDRQITNLTRFSLFFPEQRQFFIENSDLFANFGFSQIRPFFSRRIGLKDGRNIPIYGGARLSGKLNRNWRVGVMNVQTKEFSSGETKANAENFTVAAFQRQVFARSSIGAIVVNKESFSGPDSSALRYNRVAGIDYNIASKDNRWQGKLFYHQSFWPGQPKNAYAHASWLAYSDQNWFIMWNHEYVGNNYRAETGFVPRQYVYDQSRDIEVPMTFWRLEPEIDRTFYPKNSRIYSVTTGFYVNYYADSALRDNDAIYNPFVQLVFLNTSNFKIAYGKRFTRLYFPIDVTGSGKTPLPVGSYHYQDAGVEYNSNIRKLLNFNVYATGGGFFNGRKFSVGGTINYRVQPWGSFSLTVSNDEIRLPEPYGRTRLTLISP
ncbi:MAG TPA: DUF5916 domain-containing protein, partial [Bacteroidia bacterium]|nr:DUF5916 domain-containing protein [Bacteroidia bacterium]